MNHLVGPRAGSVIDGLLKPGLNSVGCLTHFSTRCIDDMLENATVCEMSLRSLQGHRHDADAPLERGIRLHRRWKNSVILSWLPPLQRGTPLRRQRAQLEQEDSATTLQRLRRQMRSKAT